MASYVSTIGSSCGVALGGLGTGSVELLPDGEFHAWQIANPPRWARECREEPADDGEGDTGALSFWVRTKAPEGEPVVRKLGQKIDFSDFTYTMYAWNKPVKKIEFDGEFPVVHLRYTDEALPLSLSMKAIAPFAPLREKQAGLPGFRMEFLLKNISPEEQEVSLLGRLEPSFVKGSTRNSLIKEENALAVFFQSIGSAKRPSAGNCTLAMEGDGRKSYILSDYFRFLKEYVAGGPLGVSQESFLFNFRETGSLPDSEGEGHPPFPSPQCAAPEKRVRELARYASFASLLRRIQSIRPDFPKNTEEARELLAYWERQKNRIGRFYGAAALASAKKLAPGEEMRLQFTFTWYFPNHYSVLPQEERMGHYYENLVSSSREASELLTGEASSLFREAAAFSKVLYRASLPIEWRDAWSVHLSTLVKDSWWLRDGSFGLWEGLGYCGFHTTDISYHASFPLAWLFPGLEKAQMKMGAAFQREDGRVHHFFTPDLKHVDGGFDRVDMNPQFVLMVARDALLWGDKDYLADLWPHCKKAIEAIATLDTDGDGLPDRDTGANTYDAWRFSGAPAYISLLWLASLKAGMSLAEKMQEAETAGKWRELLMRGKESLEKLLWNGEYYDLWRDGASYDATLMTDQLDGEWYLRRMGLGGNLPDERVREILRTIFRTNFDPEDGLKNASYSHAVHQKRKVSLATYQNCQAEAVWSGIGYAFASLALEVGETDIAFREMESLARQHAAFGRVWNHWECGYRYTRPLSSFATLLSVIGIKADGFKKVITLCPAVLPLRAPVVAPGFWGEIDTEKEKITVTVLSGNADGWQWENPDGIPVEVIVRLL